MVSQILSTLPSFKKSKNGSVKSTDENRVIESVVNQALGGLSKMIEKFKLQCINFIRDQLKTLRDTTPAYDKLQELKENMRD